MTDKVFLTGAGGFVGTYLRAALADRYPKANLVGLTGVDLLDRDAIDAVVATTRPDIVVHLAAQASVARTMRETGATFAVNLGGSLNLALAVARHVPKAALLFISSAEVYGASFLSGPVTEASPPVPLNPYAQSKWLAEQMFAAVLPASARLIVARPSNHTGAGQSEDYVLPSFAGQVARIEAGDEPPRLMVGNIDVRRDILDVRDVVAAYLALLDAAPQLPSRFTCNVGSGTTRPLRTYIETFRDLSAAPFEIVVDPARVRAVDVPVAELDTALIRQVTGWAPEIDIDDTLRGLLDTARRSLVPARHVV